MSNKNTYNLKIVEKILNGYCDYSVYGNKDIQINNAGSISNGLSSQIKWINEYNNNNQSYIKNNISCIIICHNDFDESLFNSKNCYIKVNNPRLTFAQVVNELFKENELIGTDKSAIISKNTKIGNKVYIGPNTIVGDNCIIGNNTIIHGNCSIYKNVIIGNNVTINSGCVIGSDGFGYERKEDKEFVKFPHLGGVKIGNNVEIGANTTIDKGALDYTIIEDGVKIDNLIHIAHNVKVGKNTAIIANCMVAGSVIIGENSWIGPSTSILESIRIGDNSFIGMGSVVIKNIPNEEVWVGVPARFLKINKI